MTVLRYTVPPENEGCKLGLFLRMQGVTAGLIKSVKYDGDGFYADDQPSARMSLYTPGSASALRSLPSRRRV